MYEARQAFTSKNLGSAERVVLQNPLHLFFESYGEITKKDVAQIINSLVLDLNLIQNLQTVHNNIIPENIIIRGTSNNW